MVALIFKKKKEEISKSNKEEDVRFILYFIPIICDTQRGVLKILMRLLEVLKACTIFPLLIFLQARREEKFYIRHELHCSSYSSGQNITSSP